MNASIMPTPILAQRGAARAFLAAVDGLRLMGGRLA